MDVLVTESHGSDLLVHLYKLYQTSALCDVIIQCRDGVEFNVHRIVLSASSRFLHQTFTANPSLLCVKLDMLSSVVQPLLEYSYTGQLFLSHQLQHSITEAATFLQMYTALDLIKSQTDRWTDSEPSVARDTSHRDNYTETTDRTRIKVQSSTDEASNTEKLEDDGEDEEQCMFIDLGEAVSEQDGGYHGNHRIEQDTHDNIDDRTNTSDAAESISVKTECFPQGQSSMAEGMSSIRGKDTSHSQKVTSLPPQMEKETRQNVAKAQKRMESLRGMPKDHLEVKDTVNGCEMTKDITTLPYALRRNRRRTTRFEDEHDEQNQEVSRSENKMSRSEKKRFTSKRLLSRSRREDFTLMRRSKSKQKIYVPEEGNVTCKLCGVKLQSFHKLYIHKYHIHSHLYTSGIVSSYLLHKYRKRANSNKYTRSQRPNSLVSYKCNICDTQFFRYCLFTLHCRRFHEHMQLHRGLLQYVKFRSKSKKGTPLKSNHNIRKNDRNVECFSKLKTKKSLELENISKFDCEICGRMFMSRSSLSTHKRRVHVEEAELEDIKAEPGLMEAELVPKEEESGSIKTRKGVRKTKSRALKVEDESDVDELETGGSSTKRGKATGRKAGSRVKKGDHGVRRKKLFTCPECCRSMMSQSTLFCHLQTVHQYSVDKARLRQFDLPDPVTCEVSACQFITQNINTLSEHVKMVHPFIQYPCPYGDAVFQVELLLKRHFETKHAKTRRIFQCEQCDRTFPKLHNVQRHEYWKHGILHENIKVHHCDHDGCTYRTLSVTSLRSHQSKHTSEKLFQCEFCGLHLKTEICRRKHVNKMHLGIRPYLCQVCGQSFGEEHELKAHITSKHSTERQFQCPHCVYTSAVKSTFHTHMYNVHKVRCEDDKRVEYQCPHCSFTSLLHHRYQIHVNGHTNTRQYRCTICDKSFVSSSTLKAHKQWIHSSKIYTCTQCDYQTKTLQKLNEHIRVQHQLKGFKPYKCPYCDFTCATGGNTRKHVKQVHKGREVTYIRNDDMLAVARIARASGHHTPLENMGHAELEKTVACASRHHAPLENRVHAELAKSEACVKLEETSALTVVE